jgi:hypothetical protein
VVLVEVETEVGIRGLGRKGEDEIFVLSGVSFIDRLAYITCGFGPKLHITLCEEGPHVESSG